jgi:hypothetical protein
MCPVSLRKLPAIIAVGLFFALASSASATSFTLQDTNLTGVSNVGAVVVTNTGTDQVTVTITMNAGFSIKLNGGDVAINGPMGLTAGSVAGIAAASGTNTYSGLIFKGFKTSQNISQFGTFDFDYTNIKGAPGGVVSADSLTFMLSGSGLNASQFTSFAIHFCTASGTNCGPSTGFATNGPTTATPEIGSLGMFGTGLLAIGTLVRRSVVKAFHTRE